MLPQEENTEIALKRLSMLQISLNWLIWIWLVAPTATIVCFFLRSIGLPVLIELVLPLFYLSVPLSLALSTFYLARSASGRLEALKIMAIPMLLVFMGIILLSTLFADDGLLPNFAVMVMGMGAPIWLSEILRLRAFRLNLGAVAIFS